MGYDARRPFGRPLLSMMPPLTDSRLLSITVFTLLAHSLIAAVSARCTQQCVRDTLATPRVFRLAKSSATTSDTSNEALYNGRQFTPAASISDTSNEDPYTGRQFTPVAQLTHGAIFVPSYLGISGHRLRRCSCMPSRFDVTGRHTLLGLRYHSGCKVMGPFPVTSRAIALV